MSAVSDEVEAKVPLWNNPVVRSIVSQVLLVALLIWLGYNIVGNTIVAMGGDGIHHHWKNGATNINIENNIINGVGGQRLNGPQCQDGYHL